MKLLKILVTLIIIYTVFGIPLIYASSSIDPAINRVALPQGQRAYGSVIYKNGEDRDVEVKIAPYYYNPKTDDISEDARKIFIKADTDTITVKANSTFNIKYEIYPIANLAEGTYFNILALTPILNTKDVNINQSISQLVILDIVDENDQIKGIATTNFEVNLSVERKGIPFVTPLVLKYTITNKSNFVLTPNGRIDVFNDRNSYPPTYIYINSEREELYPNEVFEKEVKSNTWHFSDLFIKRVATAHIYNGLDNNPKDPEIEINSYILEIIVGITSVIVLTLLIKSLKKDFKKKN